MQLTYTEIQKLINNDAKFRKYKMEIAERYSQVEGGMPFICDEFSLKESAVRRILNEVIREGLITEECAKRMCNTAARNAKRHHQNGPRQVHKHYEERLLEMNRLAQDQFYSLEKDEMLIITKQFLFFVREHRLETAEYFVANSSYGFPLLKRIFTYIIDKELLDDSARKFLARAKASM